MTHIGVIHGDPHLGNYTLAPYSSGEGAERLNLLDFGCIRIFPPKFVAGVVRLYRALANDDRPEQIEAYRTWGFANLHDGLVDALNVWARFIYGPLLDDRVRTVADGVAPGDYGRREAFRVRQAPEGAGPGHHPARIRVHGPRGRSASAPPSCTWAPNITGAPCSRPRWKGFLRRRWRRGRWRRWARWG